MVRDYYILTFKRFLLSISNLLGANLIRKALKSKYCCILFDCLGISDLWAHTNCRGKVRILKVPALYFPIHFKGANFIRRALKSKYYCILYF